MKKIISVMLSINITVLLFVFSATFSVGAITQSEFDSKINSLRSQYPNYSTWANQSFDGGTECYGFARLIGYNVFGSYPSSWSRVYSIDNVKKGDILQYGNTSGSGHTVFVTNVSGDTITFVDCNGNGNYSGSSYVRYCGIKWDNTISKYGKMFNRYNFSYLLSSPDISYSDNIVSYGFDYPNDYQNISDESFRFQGWINATKSIESITCSINDGENYVVSQLYKRSDVPNANAFLADIPTKLLHIGYNKVSICVNYIDGTGEVAAYRMVNRTKPTVIFGFDSPVENEKVYTDDFKFNGWVESDKDIKTITCSINDGENYIESSLYNREDVPKATAFLAFISPDLLKYGKNYISVCVTYIDGTSETICRRIVEKVFQSAIDYPKEKEVIYNNEFQYSGWVLSNKDISEIYCVVNDTDYYKTDLYCRDDVPNAISFRVLLPKKALTRIENSLRLVVKNSDGTVNKSISVTAFLSKDNDVDLDGLVSVTDATLLQKYVVGIATLTDDQKLLADCNGDGAIDVRDATYIQKTIVKIPV